MAGITPATFGRSSTAEDDDEADARHGKAQSKGQSHQDPAVECGEAAATRSFVRFVEPQEVHHLGCIPEAFVSACLLLAALPNPALLVLFIEFLNSVRWYVLSSVQFQYITSEFHLSDKEAGELIGMRATLQVIFGLAGSILADLLGVRLTSLVGMATGLIGRGLITFGQSKIGLTAAYLGFGPFGESILYTGLYKVALKKLTTPRTRTVAFAISYAINNLAGAVGDVMLDIFSQGGDFHFGVGDNQFVYTGRRMALVVSWLASLLGLILGVLYIWDETVLDNGDPEPEAEVEDDDGEDVEFLGARDDPPQQNPKEARSRQKFKEAAEGIASQDREQLRDTATYNDSEAEPSVTAVDGKNGEQHRELHFLAALRLERKLRLASYATVPTATVTAAAAGDEGESKTERKSWDSAVQFARNYLYHLCRSRELWIVVCFSLCSFPVCSQWSATSILLPAYLERTFGEAVPIFSILSVNFWGCAFLPPIFALLTSHVEPFQLFLPGLWFMGSSVIIMALMPTPLGAFMWQVALTLGEIVWNPRFGAWAATMAPTGREGIFLAFANARQLLVPLLDVVYGFLADNYVPNCKHLGCRDPFGHFCSIRHNNGTCVSREGSCSSGDDSVHLVVAPHSGNAKGGHLFSDHLNNTAAIITSACPSTCVECPGWVSDRYTLWGIVATSTLAGPLLAWFFLPFMRGHERRKGCYGIFRCGRRRLLGVCGALGKKKSASGTAFEDDLAIPSGPSRL